MPPFRGTSRYCVMNEQPKLRVVFFRTEAGNEPVREWLQTLDKVDKRRIGTDIEKIRFRWPLGISLVRKMETDLWEIRSTLQRKRIARILFTVADSDMVLLHGFIKKSQKTPRKDLRLARKRRGI